MKFDSGNRYLILQRDGFRCVYCGMSPQLDEAVLCLDHIVPFSKDGKTTAENLATACSGCNGAKGSRMLDDDAQKELLAEIKRRNVTHGIDGKLDISRKSCLRKAQDTIVAIDHSQNQVNSPTKRMQAFQQQFLAWLGPDPNKGAAIVAERSGYSLTYVRWVAGLIGKKQWPGSRKFIRAMAKLGCSNKKWRDRSPEELRRALRYREVLYDPSPLESTAISQR